MDETLPVRLRRLREERKPVRSMAVVSELCGLSPGAVKQYERGRRRPGADALVALADYYGVSVDYILCRTDRRETEK